MKPYSEMTKEELLELKRDLSDQYREFQGKNLTLDMSRGKPSAEQLDLSMGMMDVLSSDTDLRRWDRLPQLRRPGRYQRGEGAVSGYDRGSG